MGFIKYCCWLCLPLLITAPLWGQDELKEVAKDTTIVLSSDSIDNNLISPNNSRGRYSLLARGSDPEHAALRALLPGLGHYYIGQNAKSLIWTGAVGAAAANMVYAYQRDTSPSDYRKNSTSIFMGVYALSILDAYAQAHIQLEDRPHSPIIAAYRSALFPGWGQMYNRKFWKVPIVYTALAAGGYYVQYSYERHNYYLDLYWNPEDGILDAQFKPYKDRWRRRRDFAIILTSALYLLNIIDAVVDGHLYGFDVEDLSSNLKVQPNVFLAPDQKLYQGFSLSYRF